MQEELNYLTERINMTDGYITDMDDALDITDDHEAKMYLLAQMSTFKTEKKILENIFNEVFHKDVEVLSILEGVLGEWELGLPHEEYSIALDKVQIKLKKINYESEIRN